MACPCLGGEEEKEFEATGLPDGLPGQESMGDARGAGDMGGPSLFPSPYGAYFLY